MGSNGKHQGAVQAVVIAVYKSHNHKKARIAVATSGKVVLRGNYNPEN